MVEIASDVRWMETTNDIRKTDRPSDARRKDMTDDVIRVNTTNDVMRVNTVGDIIRVNTANDVMRSNTTSDVIRTETARGVMRKASANSVSPSLPNTATNVMRDNTANDVTRTNTASDVMRVNTASDVMRTASDVIRENTTNDVTEAKPTNDVMMSNTADDVTRTELARDVTRKAAPAAAAVNSVSPNLLEPFAHQVAGQSLVFCYGADAICKSLIGRELRVYQTMPDSLRPYVPEYRGVVDIALSGPKLPQKDRGEEKDEEEGVERGGVEHPLTTQRHLDKVVKSQKEDNVYHFLLLENIVSGYNRPCVLDLKLGTRQHGDDAPTEKVHYQVNKCLRTTSALLGVRLCGMKVFQSATGNYVKVDKTEGRRMRENDFREAMRNFLFDGRHIRRELIPALLLKLQKLKAAISELPSFRFYSSSLLVVYDGRQCWCRCNHGGMKVSDACSTVLTNGTQEYKSDLRIAGECNGDSTARVCDAEGVSCITCGDLTWRSSHDSVHNSLKLESNQHQERNGECFCQRPELNISNGQTVKTAHSSSTTDCQIQHRHHADSVLDRTMDFEDCSFVENSGTGRNFSHKTRLPTNEITEEHSPCEPDTVCNTHPETVGLTRGAVRMCQCCANMVDVRMVDFAHTTHAGLSENVVVHEGPDQGCLRGLSTLIDTFTHIYRDTAMTRPE